METQPELVGPTPGADRQEAKIKTYASGGAARTRCGYINRQTGLLRARCTVQLWAQPSSAATACFSFLFSH